MKLQQPQIRRDRPNTPQAFCQPRMMLTNVSSHSARQSNEEIGPQDDKTIWNATVQCSMPIPCCHFLTDVSAVVVNDRYTSVSGTKIKHRTLALQTVGLRVTKKASIGTFPVRLDKLTRLTASPENVPNRICSVARRQHQHQDFCVPNNQHQTLQQRNVLLREQRVMVLPAGHALVVLVQHLVKVIGEIPMQPLRVDLLIWILFPINFKTSHWKQSKSKYANFGGAALSLAFGGTGGPAFTGTGGLV